MRYRTYFREGFNLPKDQQDNYFNREVDFDTEEKHLGVIVWENRVAKVPFSNQIFCGDYDERYVYGGSQVTRVFAGPGVHEYEALRPAD
jgi:hypothetical protein